MAKILLVEDDKSLREIYGVRLMAEGYTITSAGDGEEALAVAIKERPDLIVSDVMMPKISGFDMLDILRSTTETKDIKVIMMTALSSEDQRARGESLGADRYLVKSQVGIEDVVRTVHDVLGDGIGGAAPAPATPAPVAEPAAPVEPAPEVAPTPVAAVAPEPVAAPIPAPVVAEVPVPFVETPAPQVAPTASEPISATPPVVPTDPIVPEPIATPAPVAEPAVAPIGPIADVPAPAAPAPIAAVTPEPIPAPVTAPIFTPAPEAVPTPIAPAPVAPVTLPEPTAPFSSNGPASLGDRVINPLPSADGLASNGVSNIADQMNQELNAHLQDLQATPAPAAPTIPVDPVPAPAAAPTTPDAPLPPLPPQPGI
jgi:CheY-like chemotaxis protein